MELFGAVTIVASFFAQDEGSLSLSLLQKEQNLQIQWPDVICWTDGLTEV